jgi:hypothetical protein
MMIGTTNKDCGNLGAGQATRDAARNHRSRRELVATHAFVVVDSVFVSAAEVPHYGQKHLSTARSRICSHAHRL